MNGRSRVRNFEEVIQLDLRYQENWSLGYDLQLIFKTILILFQKNSGAFRRIFNTPFEIKLTNFNKIDVYLGMCKHLKNRYHG